MSELGQNVRVLYSFPHKLGADRICYTAWQQVNGLAAAGADVLVFAGALQRPVPASVRVQTTLARGKMRIPYKLIGAAHAFAFHDFLVSLALERLHGKIDIVHTWPLGAKRTLQAAARLGIPTVLERPNAHTRYAMDVVRDECVRLGITLPANHEHAHNTDKLKLEEQEYQLATRLLCPSEFVKDTFIRNGFSADKLARHSYGFDEKLYFPNGRPSNGSSGLRMLFVGGCAPRKGLHYALEAWLQSSAHHHGTFQIAGGFVPAYQEKLSAMLAHPSVRILGHRKDVAELMRRSDILVLPSIEEGSALVTSEARGSGCVLLVSDAAGAICDHMENALVHRTRDVATLAGHMTMLDQDRLLLQKLRDASLRTVHEITWSSAGRKLLEAYQQTILLAAS